MPSKRNDSTSNSRLYSEAYREIDFRKNPQAYLLGRGEQGVLIVEPYKSEILPHWKFATPDKAKVSARAIFEMFDAYKRANDFVGMDMARKFLQMGFTRSRRYANHSSGTKYNDDRSVKEQDGGSEDSPKAESARIFYEYYIKAKDDREYQSRLAEHKRLAKPLRPE